jgi:hypothetical protein
MCVMSFAMSFRGFGRSIAIGLGTGHASSQGRLRQSCKASVALSLGIVVSRFRHEHWYQRSYSACGWWLEHYLENMRRLLANEITVQNGVIANVCSFTPEVLF